MNKKEIKAFIKTLKRLDIILVDWVDAEQDNGDEWKDIDTPIGSRVVTAKTIGFYTKHNKELLRTYCNYDPSNNLGTGRNDIQISNIKNIVKLNPHI